MKLFKKAPLADKAALSDADRLRKTALRVGINTSLTAAGIGLLFFAILAVLSPIFEKVRAAGGGPQAFSAENPLASDRAHIVFMTVVFLALGIVSAGLIGWLAARPAVAPMAEFLRLQRNFVADASHELRTPLTVINARLQVLEKRIARDEPIDEIVRQLRADTNSMADVLNDLLLAAEGNQVTPGSPCSVAESVHEAIASLTVIAEEAQVRIEIAVSEDVAVQLPRTALTRCAVALIDNAIQHSPPNGVATISITCEREHAVLRVRDTGAGILGIDPSEVFERFSHASENQSRRSFGLGLALVNDIAARYGGSIAVESTSKEGTCMALALPAASTS